MDLKTFEYMKERTEKASSLIEQIGYYNNHIESINEGVSLAEISVRAKNGEKSYILPADYKDRDQLFEMLKPALIEAYTKKRDELQNELDQL